MSLQRLLGVYRSASTATVLDGRSWYQEAFQSCLEIADSYDLPVELVAALVAILSPNNSWEQNLDDASTVIEYYQYSGVENVYDCKVLTYNRNKEKAFSLLWEIDYDGTSYDAAVRAYVRGPKVSAFHRAILGDRNALVLDSHCINAWYGRRIEGQKLSAASASDRRQCTADYIKGASATGEAVSAFQAIVWLRHLERIQQGKIPGYSRVNLQRRVYVHQI